MIRWIVLVSGLIGVLSACGSAVPESASAPSPGSSATRIVFVTALPATPTLLPTSTATQVVVEQATATPSPEPTVLPTETPLPTLTATATAEVDWLSTVGRTENNLVYLGNPEAPVSVIDYSDFM